ncbi:family 78 glycoside hydrolase catalytic domain [Herbiconiux sp. VKM Ac-1786]|uniref:alpha-L-rhamnosidase n=1 Tax=Herbiconiux sp. VKM Ac-1786 TaxID=2783824 RepID=UPI00188A2DB8|nr:alpha-L-rhamnosidase [Herbiconiux sp. VKM Ac-1786]MBF4571798.1 family 78 glycoside hydrolase catalytic domain [Herbiconiux sp. VKM Ac-1786]
MLEPYDLETDRQTAPSGIVSPPSFSWRLRGTARGDSQTAYRITVNAELGLGSASLVWDSGWHDSASTAGIPYTGAPLMSSTAYSWRLELRGARGETPTTAARFETAVVHPDEWRAHWIARNPIYTQIAPVPQDTDISYTVNKLKPVRRFAKHFTLDAVPRRAVVHSSAKGIYRLYVNGHRVGRDELVPGWTEYRERIAYQSHDVTALLVEGENSIAALLGDGWWCGFIGTDRRHHAQHYGDEPAFLAQLELGAADGGRTVVATDETWRESASEILYADLLMGQYEDARQRVDDWHLTSHPIGEWSSAVVVDSGHSLLVPESDPAVRAIEALPARSVTTRIPGHHVVDFGQNLVGHVALTLRGVPAGTRVQLDHAEVLKDDGSLYTENLRTVEATDVYVTRGDEVEVFEPRFTLHGFRFAEISGLEAAPDAADIEAVVIHNDFAPAGELETDDGALNQLVSNIRWGLRDNFVAVPTDCPQRDERLGWTADAQVFTPTALYEAQLLPFLRRWLRDLRSAQSAEGAFPDTAPHMVHKREGAPAWGDGGVTIPWALYTATGSEEVLRESIDSMVAWVRYLHLHNPGLLWVNRRGNDYGDWLSVGEQTSKDVLATAYFARSTELTARALRVLGRNSEAAEFEELLAGIRSAFLEAYVTDDGLVEGDTQTGYLLALGFDLVPAEWRDAVAAHLVRAVERRGPALTTGFIGVALLLPVLTSIGRSDLAFSLLHRDEYPSWLYSVKNGATTIWERWDGWTSEHGFQSARMNSFNHYSFGSVGEWLYRSLAGIGQTDRSVAFGELEIAPQFDPSLTRVRAAHESPRGRIEASWHRSEGRVEFALTVPPGSTAHVALPARAASQIEEGGAAAVDAEGIALETETDQVVRFTVESGSYHFRLPDPALVAV